MAAPAPAAPVFATRKQIDDLTDDFSRMTEGLSELGYSYTGALYNELDKMGERITPELMRYANWMEKIQRDIYLSARAWFDLVGKTPVHEEGGPPSGAPGGAAAFPPTNIPLETYNKWDKHSLKLVKLERDCGHVIKSLMDNLRWNIAPLDPGERPPGAEGHGMPHMRRGEEWQAGVNRRR